MRGFRLTYGALVVGLLCLFPLVYATGHTPLCRVPRYMFLQSCVALCHENIGQVTVEIQGATWPGTVSLRSAIDGVEGSLLNIAGTTTYSLTPTVSTDTFTFCAIAADTHTAAGSVSITVQLTTTTTHTMIIPIQLHQNIPTSATVTVGPGEILDSLEMALLFRAPNTVLITLEGQIPCPLVCDTRSVLVIDRSANISPPEAEIRHCTCNSIRVQANAATQNVVTLCNMHIQQLTIEPGSVVHGDNMNMQSVDGHGIVTIFTRNDFDPPTPGGVQLQTGSSKFPALTVVSSIVTVDSALQQVVLELAPPLLTAPAVGIIDTNFTNGLTISATSTADSATLITASHFPLPGLTLNLLSTTAAVGITRNAFEKITIVVTGGGVSQGLQATEGKLDVDPGAGTPLDHARLISIANAWTPTSIVDYNGVQCIGECRIGMTAPLRPDQLLSMVPLSGAFPTTTAAGVRIVGDLQTSPGVVPTLIAVRRRQNSLEPWIEVVKTGCLFAIDCSPIPTREDPLDTSLDQWYAGPPWFFTQSLQSATSTPPSSCTGGERAGSLCTSALNCAESFSLATPVVCTPFDGSAIELVTTVPVQCASPDAPNVTPIPCVYTDTGASFSTLVPVAIHGNQQYEVVIQKALSNPYREYGDIGDTCKSLDGAKRCQLALANLFPSSFFALFQTAFANRRFAITIPGTVTENFAFQINVACLNGTILDLDLGACLYIPPSLPSIGISQSAFTTAQVATGAAFGIAGIIFFIEILYCLLALFAEGIGTSGGGSTNERTKSLQRV